jgi:Ca2+-binding EF-hand superfamily protein
MTMLLMRLTLGLAILLSSVDGLSAQGRPLRFRAMDRNGDGVITRAEWRGTDRSFEHHDWNGDGQLSGDEVRTGAMRPERPWDPEFDSADREYVFDDWTSRGFLALDHNRDNRITRDEWHFDREGFRRADHNGDGVITRAEFLNENGEDDDRGDRWTNLDVDGDGRVSEAEWHGTAARFGALDANNDRFLSRAEMTGMEPPPDLFSNVDINRDRAVSRDEWHWSRASFDQRDLNRDGRLTRDEFDGTASAQTRSQAYKAGFERGQIEGREAGRAERLNNRAWDLEGQRELETADSGYQASMGSRADYQAGYREGFRRAYGQGWNEARKK